MSSTQQVSGKTLTNNSDDKVVLLQEVRSNWVLQLDNVVLRKLVENQAPHVRPNSDNIEAINQAYAKLVGDREFAQRLHLAGLFLSAQQIKRANEENRQIFYRNQIENTTLRHFLSDYPLQTSRWEVIAKNQIDTLNKLLHRPLFLDALKAALKRLGVMLDDEQMQTVIQESKLQNELSPYVSARNEYEALQKLLLNLDIKSIKSQFSGYLSLILNESALSETEISALKEELDSIVIRKTVPVRVKNPFLVAIQSVQQKVEQLHRKRILLSLESESILTNQLINRIDKLLLRIGKHSYDVLFRQFMVLEKWANGVTVSDAQFQEIKNLAPRRVLERTEARALLSKLHYQVFQKALIS